MLKKQEMNSNFGDQMNERTFFNLSAITGRIQEILQPYIVFVNGGYQKSPVYIKKIVNRFGEVIEENVKDEFDQPYLDLVDEL